MWIVLWLSVAVVGIVIPMVRSDTGHLKRTLRAGAYGFFAGLYLFHAGQNWGGRPTDFHYPIGFAAVVMLATGLKDILLTPRDGSAGNSYW